MQFVDDGEFAALSREGVQIVDGNGHLVERAVRTIQWDPVSAEKGGFDHFMQKEIFEQPRAIRDTIGTRVREDELDIDLDGIEFTAEDVKKLERVTLLACGTAYYASMIGKYLIEQYAGIPAEVDLASEYRYRQPIVDQSCLVVPVSQSGETADTLAALREGKDRGARVLSICNTRESTIARESHDVLYTVAGPEIGVASTKCFTTQFVALYLLALKLGIARKHLDGEQLRDALSRLHQLPRMVEETLQLDAQVKAVAQRYFRASNFLFLGRGVMYPIAMEGALKLKEISYIHAEGYAAGEMKHGPIALIDENMPVVVIANQSHVYEKVVSNLEEVRARDGQVIAIASVGDEAIEEKVDAVIRIPDFGDPLTALLATIRCSSWPTTWPRSRAPTWTSRATSRRASRSSRPSPGVAREDDGWSEPAGCGGGAARAAGRRSPSPARGRASRRARRGAGARRVLRRGVRTRRWRAPGGRPGAEAADGRPDTPPGSPNARPEVVAELLADLERVRHESDGGGSVRLLEVAPGRSARAARPLRLRLRGGSARDRGGGKPALPAPLLGLERAAGRRPRCTRRDAGRHRGRRRPARGGDPRREPAGRAHRRTAAPPR